MSFRQRSHARVLALQALCLFDALGDAFADQLERFLVDADNYADLDWRRPPGPELIGFARTLALGAWQERAASDDLLARHVVGWSVQRMQPVDRNILRMGLYELRQCPDRPHQVVINEAIELARRFGGAESPAFVNGVLDGLRKELAAHAAEASSAVGEGRPGGATEEQ
jgi:N utilization substance protein B